MCRRVRSKRGSAQICRAVTVPVAGTFILSHLTLPDALAEVEEASVLQWVEMAGVKELPNEKNSTSSRKAGWPIECAETGEISKTDRQGLIGFYHGFEHR